MGKPIIALTMGDASGIGPELVAKALADDGVYHRCQPVVIGDPDVINDAIRLINLNKGIKCINDIKEAGLEPSCIEVFKPSGVAITEIRRGVVDPVAGRSAVICLKEAYSFAIDGKISGVVSAPMNKEAFHQAGFHYLDELELLAEYTAAPAAFIMGVMGSLWTVAVTTHIAFRDIAANIKQKSVLSHITALHGVLTKIGVEIPRIAVAALNVHGGEGGLYGREEIDEIIPAIEQAVGSGMNVAGPIPADSIFVRAVEGEFDGVVSMYHDQATIIRKFHAKRTGATIFIGLPVVCGTTAHGTAFDIAGQGVAEPGSFLEALEYAIRLAATV